MKSNIVRKEDFLIVIVSVLMIYLGALISFSIPYIDIPITGQSMMVLVLAFLLPRRIGMMSVIFYIILGCLGLPIFADGQAGIEILRGKSGGYLYGFILGSWVVYQLKQKKEKLSWIRILYGMIIGTIFIVGIGYMHLAQIIGYEPAFDYGVKPFILGGMIKSFLGTGLVVIIRPYVNKLL